VIATLGDLHIFEYIAVDRAREDPDVAIAGDRSAQKWL